MSRRPPNAPQRKSRTRSAQGAIHRNQKAELVEQFKSGAVLDLPPPAGLSPRWVEAWDIFCSGKLAALVTPEDVPALEHLWKLYSERDDLERVHSRMGLYAPIPDEGELPDPMYQFIWDGKAGWRRNPIEMSIRRIQNSIDKYEQLFGITPSHRAKLGITFGEMAITLAEASYKAAAEHEIDLGDAGIELVK